MAKGPKEKAGEAAGAGNGGKPRTVEEVAAALKDAQGILDGLQQELAQVEGAKQVDDENDKIIAAYEAARPELKDTQDDLDQFRLAEVGFAETMLMKKTRDAIDKVLPDLEQATELSAPRERLPKAKAELKTARDNLEAAKVRKEMADAALKAKVGTLTAIRDRLKAAETLRAEANKAEEAHDYSLAYWLVREGGSLDLAIRAEPQLIESKKLRGLIEAEQAKLASAVADIATHEAKVKTLEEEIKTKTATVAGLEATLDKRARAAASAIKNSGDEPA